MRRAGLLPLALLLLGAAPAGAQQSHLLVVSGLGGEPQYVDAFHEWAMSMAGAARDRYGLAAGNVAVLTENPDRAPGAIQGRSTRENVLRALQEAAGRAGPDDDLLVLLIGHGSSDGTDSRLNLSGPDLTAKDLASALAAFPTQRVAVVNAASASGGFVEALSGRNRVVVTATQSPFERNETTFGRFFVEAYAGEGADTDKDGRVSVLEAFDYARREVARVYGEERRMLTEHALLDDDADGKGTREPDPRAGDGAVARRFVLSGGGAARATAAASPEHRALLERQARLEGELEALRARRDALPAEEYQRELERLLLEVARTGQAIRQLGGSQ